MDMTGGLVHLIFLTAVSDSTGLDVKAYWKLRNWGLPESWCIFYFRVRIESRICLFRNSQNQGKNKRQTTGGYITSIWKDLNDEYLKFAFLICIIFPKPYKVGLQTKKESKGLGMILSNWGPWSYSNWSCLGTCSQVLLS